ncbi:SigB/SigF/SigG family RNA polymerase sigma factor [Actinoplanes sp. HUAS TT8]|uniref:SigB/SigF/SigG family RNA polymerase sigma factor n=1 Tax=Actinoplanes sp. HUAS TT8 TaxID=3447453 RepID=UPI003F51B6A5
MSRTSDGCSIAERADEDVPTRLLTALATLPVEDPGRRVVRGQAIEAWVPLARRLAGRYAGHGVPMDDLVQTATLGLIKAVDRFDPEHGACFVGFAVPTILGEIKRYFRDRTWMIRLPRRLQELRLAITAANAELTQLLSRSPTVADVAAHLGLTEEAVLEGLEGARAYETVSLSTPRRAENGYELIDVLGDDDQAYAEAEARIALTAAMAVLDERLQRILTLRFYGSLSQSEIAGQLGVSQMHVSRLLAQALRELRGHLEVAV